MGPVKDVQTVNDDNTMAAQGDGSPYVRTETRPPMTRPQTGADSAGDNDANCADNALQVEEPGYGYGV
jgi:hypothetical protein